MAATAGKVGPGTLTERPRRCVTSSSMRTICRPWPGSGRTGGSSAGHGTLNFAGGGPNVERPRPRFLPQAHPWIPFAMSEQANLDTIGAARLVWELVEI
jgi:hypothetical protein